MKKIFASILLCAMTALTLTACDKKAESNEFVLHEAKMDKFVTELGAYQNLTVEAAKDEITDDMIDYYLPYFFQTAAEENIKDYVASNGCTVNIDYVGTIDGIAFQGGTAQAQYLELGSHSYIDGFEEGLVGVKAGDVVELNLKFPDNYGAADLAGKDCVFTVTVNNVIPEMNDDGIKALGSDMYSTVEEYRNVVKDVIVSYNEEEYRNKVAMGATDQVIAATTFGDIPETLIEAQKKLVEENYSETATSYGITVEALLGYYGSSVDELALNYAKQQLVFQSIANAENLNVTEEELDAAIDEVVNSFENLSSRDDFYAQTSREEYRNYLMANKVFEYLVENTVVTAPTE